MNIASFNEKFTFPFCEKNGLLASTLKNDLVLSQFGGEWLLWPIIGVLAVCIYKGDWSYSRNLES